MIRKSVGWLSGSRTSRCCSSRLQATSRLSLEDFQSELSSANPARLLMLCAPAGARGQTGRRRRRIAGKILTGILHGARWRYRLKGTGICLALMRRTVQVPDLSTYVAGRCCSATPQPGFHSLIKAKLIVFWLWLHIQETRDISIFWSESWKGRKEHIFPNVNDSFTSTL